MAKITPITKVREVKPGKEFSSSIMENIMKISYEEFGKDEGLTYEEFVKRELEEGAKEYKEIQRLLTSIGNYICSD